MVVLTYLLPLGLLGLALYALIKMDLEHVHVDLRALLINLKIDIGSKERREDDLSQPGDSHPTCYQPFGANPGSVVVAHAVRNNDPNWSVAGEPLSGQITMEAWPGRGPACPACERVLARSRAVPGERSPVFGRRRPGNGGAG